MTHNPEPTERNTSAWSDAAYLQELADTLSLALDVSEKPAADYTQHEKELRRYLKASKRYVAALMEAH